MSPKPSVSVRAIRLPEIIVPPAHWQISPAATKVTVLVVEIGAASVMPSTVVVRAIGPLTEDIGPTKSAWPLVKTIPVEPPPGPSTSMNSPNALTLLT